MDTGGKRRCLVRPGFFGTPCVFGAASNDKLLRVHAGSHLFIFYYLNKKKSSLLLLTITIMMLLLLFFFKKIAPKHKVTLTIMFLGTLALTVKSEIKEMHHLLDKLFPVVGYNPKPTDCRKRVWYFAQVTDLLRGEMLPKWSLPVQHLEFVSSELFSAGWCMSETPSVVSGLKRK